MVTLYLCAVVLANVTVYVFGPAAAVVNAFLFIGLDLTTRDALHERWDGRGLWPKMGALVLTGSVVSVLLCPGSEMVAVASGISFGVAGAVDAIVYTLAHDKPWFRRVMWSNTASAITDSLIFPTLAFGVFMPWVSLCQAIAKLTGGTLWAYILVWWRQNESKRTD